MWDIQQTLNKERQIIKKNCNNEENRNYNLKLYTMMRENGGFEMFK